MKIFITGANGFLASNIIRELISRDHEVVAFIKTGEDVSTLHDLNITMKYGNILDYGSILEAIGDCDVMIHTAADTSVHNNKSRVQYRVNVEGTINVMNAALEKKLKRVLFIGTANSFGFGTKENPGDETAPFSCSSYKMNYINTKYEAQLKVLELIRTSGLPAVILNPTFMLGPYCGKQGSGQMLLSVKDRKLPGYAKGGRNFVHVKDVAVAVANALTMGNIGESYILGNENLNYKEIFSIMASAAGVTPPRFLIPKYISAAFGLILSVLAAVFRFTPALTYRMAILSGDGNYYTARKAVAELNMPQTPIDIAVKEAYEWLSLLN